MCYIQQTDGENTLEWVKYNLLVHYMMIFLKDLFCELLKHLQSKLYAALKLPWRKTVRNRLMIWAWRFTLDLGNSSFTGFSFQSHLVSWQLQNKSTEMNQS